MLLDQSTITLYRGDYEKIKRFELHKTNSHSYLGQGVYLTDKVEVADSYRSKGADLSRDPFKKVVWRGQTVDRTAAMVKAFDHFYDDFLYATRIGRNPWLQMEWPNVERAQKAVRDRIRRVAEATWKQLVQDQHVRAEYLTPYNKYGPRCQEREIEVRLNIDLYSVGYVTKFQFPRQTFESSVVNILGTISDRMFWEIIWDSGLQNSLGTIYSDRDRYVYYNTRERSRSVPSNIPRLRAVLKPWGYRGFEYEGGRMIGGYGFHRAFVVWDEDFVNEHRVERTR